MRKFGGQKLQEILDYALANDGAAATPVGGHEAATALRRALWKRAARKGVRGLDFTVEDGTVIVRRLIEVKVEKLEQEAGSDA